MAPNKPVAAATSSLIAKFADTPAAQSLFRRVGDGGALSCAGVSAGARPFLAALLASHFPNRTVLVVTDGLKTQESFHQDLETWLSLSRGAESGSRPLFHPAWEVLPHEARLPHADVISERLEVLLALNDARGGTLPHPPVVASAAGLMQRAFPPGELAGRARVLRPGDRLDPLDLVEWLEDQGYEPEAKVTQKGELALRGGILDVFPPASPWPVRLEFFGEELESLRHFDPQTQISRGEVESAVLTPAGELGILKQAQNPGKKAPRRETATILDYLTDDTIVLLCEPEALETQARTYAGQLPENDSFHSSWEDLLEALRRRGLTRVDVAGPSTDRGEDAIVLDWPGLEHYRPLGGRTPELPVAEAQRRMFFEQMHRWLRQEFTVHVFCNNDGERQRFLEVWKEYGLDEGTDTDLIPHIGTLSRGFLDEAARQVVVTDAEIFGRYKVQRPRRLKSPHAAATRSALDIDFTELEEGDYVVHLQHGIGRYLGLQQLPSGRGRKGDSSLGEQPAPEEDADAGRECLVIEYAPVSADQPAPKLYVPVTEAHLVSKYVGAGKARPQLNALGGTRWAKAKAQAVQAVQDLASELLAIQAARDSQSGHAFPPDAPWQGEFEGAFIYEETPDQMRAIVETKADMECPKPMDRLICGDVGFGKTEVAIRAAFKAVMGGRQVALLVPTTVLAQQHYNNFRERMADYPVRVELLSRFRTRRQIQQVIRDLATGAVDIVVGTHRLVQSHIVFKDLGLVVIDEEQRFGVVHKEKFKRLRTLVDVLTLSATPIPRTLYLALTGARDMSTIQTPPQDRLPVETVVTQYDERIIRDAIQRELNRGGQVFFLHNRVATIETMAQKLRALVPRARVAVGHGQMHADDLEEVMTRFVNGEADVLLSTTIIESGLDIPNANTIIIDRADRFGLSDLYQLRGRVGRYKHQAFAYLLLPRHAGLLADARRRISAIRQYSTLGSGFKIAMRDLEIRGAGNILGPQQSGHITNVGFELYCQLLKQSVAALKGEKVRQRIEVLVRLDFVVMDPGSATTRDTRDPEIPAEGRVVPAAAWLPPVYIPDSRQRVDIYRRLAQADDSRSLSAIKLELADRFGPIPPPVEMLLKVTEVKILAAERAVTVLETQGDKLMLKRHNDFLMPGGRFPRLTKNTPVARLNEIRRLLLALQTE